MSSSLNWVVVWSDFVDGTKHRDHSRSRTLALNAACDLISRHHTVERIESRNGVIIWRKAIDKYCRARRLP